MYNQRKLNRLVFFIYIFFLDADKRYLTKFDGHPMIGKLTTPCGVTSTDYTIPTVFKGIKKNELIIVDNTRLQNLVTAVATGVDVDNSYFNRWGVILLVDSSVAVNDDELNPLMIRMRALWSAGIAVIKPWNGFITKTSLKRRPIFSRIQYHDC